MTNERHQARVLAMQALCQLDVQGDDFIPLLDRFLAEGEPAPAAQSYARRLTDQAWRDRDRLDGLIAGASEHWDLSRMPLVDRNILRVALLEMLERPEVPAPVAIDEAIEIAKEFGSADSGGFVNGILDAVRRTQASQGTTSP